MPSAICVADSTASVTRPHSDDEIYQVVRDLVAEVLCTGSELIVREARLIEDLGAESIDFLDLSFRLEQRYGVKLSVEDLKVLAGNGSNKGGYTVQSLVDFIRHTQGIAID